MRSEIEYIKQKPLANNSFTRGFFISLLSDQVSNLNSSGPKPDVLPITPSDNFQPLIY